MEGAEVEAAKFLGVYSSKSSDTLYRRKHATAKYRDAYFYSPIAYKIFFKDTSWIDISVS
jgi:hypothetical protein